MAWDALYEAQPTDSTYVADTDDAIRSTKTEIRTRVAKEHGFNLSESAPQTGHGKHLRGSARVFVSDTSVADPTTVTADDANYSTGRLQVYPTLKRLGYYSGSAWVDLIRDSSGDFEARVLKSTVATGTAPLVVASTTQVTNLKAQYAGDADNLGGVAPYFYSKFYTGGTAGNTDYPVGSVLFGADADVFVAGDMNSTVNVYTTGGGTRVVLNSSTGVSLLTGTWKMRGFYDLGTYSVFMVQRVN